MSRILFDPDVPVTPADLARTDVACFVGLVRRRARSAPKPLPPAKIDWLRAQGWLEGPTARACDELLDVPMPIENFAAFQDLYDDGHSPAAVGTDYLALAVNAFFAQGGKRCYVVRMGDPVGVDLEIDARTAIVDVLLSNGSSEQDQRSWHGIAHLFGLPDVSFLAVPDLPLLQATTVQVAPGVTEDRSSGPEAFVRCVPTPADTKDKRLYPLPAPRFDDDAYARWSATLAAIARRLATGELSDIQLVAALPLPVEGIDVADVVAARFPTGTIDLGMRTDLTALPSSAFIQLAYPWLRTTRSAIVLEGLEPPDAALVGLLARNALVRGTFTSATKVPPVDLVDTVPTLGSADTNVPATRPNWIDPAPKPLVVRVSLFGFTPAGLRLLSDVTTYAGETYRPAPTNRLLSVISRAARVFGEAHIFEGNGPRLWGALQRALRNLLTQLWSLEALEGASPAEAFDVRCGRDTMTAHDIDEGRIIAVVRFRPAATIELITVTLTVQAAAASETDILAQMAGPV